MQFLRRIYLMALLVLFAVVSLGQQSASIQSAPASGVDDDFVRKQFGDTCSLIPDFAPLKADLDGDGVEDVAIVARCKNPLPDQTDYSFKVVDPYNSYFGFGDPKITTQFASEDPQSRGISLLIIHGSGADAWRAAAPKAKFLVINLPFKQLALKKLTVHKKHVMAIYAEEAHEGEGVISALYWDGKKYKYQPMGMSME